MFVCQSLNFRNIKMFRKRAYGLTGKTHKTSAFMPQKGSAIIKSAYVIFLLLEKKEKQNKKTKKKSGK